MTLALLWRVPPRRVGLRWRGPAGLASAIERDPLTSVAAVVGPPGEDGSASFPPMPVALDATVPVPAGGLGSSAWSTLAAQPVIWDGNHWRSFAFFYTPPAEIPEWVPAGALMVSDFAAGNYWRYDLGVCELGDIWETGAGYNNPFDPVTDVRPNQGLIGSRVPQAVPSVLAMLAPAGAGFTAVMDYNVAQGIDASADALFGMIFTDSAYPNEWLAGAKLRSSANPLDSHIACGDYNGYISPIPMPDVPFLGRHRVACSIGFDGAAIALDGLATTAKQRADFTYVPLPDPAWNMLLPACFDHGDATIYLERAAFYPRADNGELEALSTSAGFGLDFTGGSLPSGTSFTRASGGARFNASGILVIEATDIARFDHDPITLAPRGLLIEPARSNLLPRSNSLTSTSWTKADCTATAGAALSPDGTASAIKLEATGGGTPGAYNSSGYSAGTPSAAIFAKAGNVAWLGFSLHGGSWAFFDIANGVVGNMANCTARIRPVGDGWYECTIESATAVSGYVIPCIKRADHNSDPWGTGPAGIAGDFLYLHQADSQAGPLATSPIATGVTSATRAADELTIEVPVGMTTAHCTIEGDVVEVAVTPGPVTLTAADFGGAAVRLQGIEFS